MFNGVGSVLSFLPTIVTLFFFLSLLEDSGYMARVAFVMDKLLRRIGLSGRLSLIHIWAHGSGGLWPEMPAETPRRGRRQGAQAGGKRQGRPHESRRAREGAVEAERLGQGAVESAAERAGKGSAEAEAFDRKDLLARRRAVGQVGGGTPSREK